MDADETQIEASFCKAIRTAREQKSIPLFRYSAGKTRGRKLRKVPQQQASGSGGVNGIILRDFLADILRVWDPCENGPTV
jgi:hypothetical protein